MKSDGITAVSEYLRRETINHFDVPPDNIEVIPNFVDLQKYKRDAYPCHRGKLAAPGEKIVMHISNFRPVKRVDDAVRVFARLHRTIPSKLVLIGDGPERGRALQVAEQEGVSRNVVFLGKQESVAELLACADLMLLPSENESFGLVALEAMACGVPVIASDVGGVSEVVTNGESGCLFAVGAIDAMAAAAIAFLSDAGRWKAASAAARAGAERFGHDAVVSQYESLYERVLNA
jgi:N-acetyl-alpha-D-glucosaminyl L-malate synthase BshA